MKDSDKIEKLKKEIARLETQKKQKEELKGLLEKRNKLKYPAIMKTKDAVKKWAENEGKRQKSSSQTKNKPRDMYDAMFGDNDASRALGFK